MLLLIIILTRNCYPSLEIVNIDVYKYSGKWHEVARLPNFFQNDCTNSSAVYTVNSDFTLGIVNQCINNKKLRKINGIGYPVTLDGPSNYNPKNTLGKFKIYFEGSPFGGDYNIIFVDQFYLNAIVGSNDRSYLWFLSRSPKIEQSVFNELSDIAKKQGFNVNKIIISHN